MNGDMCLTKVVENQTTPEMSAQKYLLQRRNHEGHLIKVETFNERVSQESVLAKFGPGYYILKATKPRFKTIWKQQIGDIQQAKEFQTLKKRTKYLTWAAVGLGATQALGFGLSHLRFSGLEERLDRITTVLQTRLTPEGLCGNCGKPLDSLLQEFCSQCGVRLLWPKKPPLGKLDEAAVECFRCKSPLLRHQIYCPYCGIRQPIPVASQLNTSWLPVQTSESGV
jgi:hypothetical protein